MLSRLPLVCLLANLRSVIHQIVNEIASPGVVGFTEALQLDSASGMRDKTKDFDLGGGRHIHKHPLTWQIEWTLLA